MAFETIRRVLGEYLTQELAAMTPQGRASILGQALQNKLRALEIEQEFPLRIAELQEKVNEMLNPEYAARKEALRERIVYEALTGPTVERTRRLKEATLPFEKELAELRYKWQEKLARTPRVYVSQRAPEAPMNLEQRRDLYLRQGYTPESVQKWYEEAKKGNDDVGLLKAPEQRLPSVPSIPQTSRENRIQMLGEKIKKNPLFQKYAKRSRFGFDPLAKDVPVAQVLAEHEEEIKKLDPELYKDLQEYVVLTTYQDVGERVRRAWGIGATNPEDPFGFLEVLR